MEEYMNYLICIDYENRADIKYLRNFPNVKYISFIGVNQKDKLKAEPGTKLTKLRMARTGENYLDWHIIEYVRKRLNISDTKFYIVSDDGIFDSFSNVVNQDYEKELVVRISKEQWKALELERKIG